MNKNLENDEAKLNVKNEKLYNENLTNKVLRISSQLIIGPMPLVLGFIIANDNSVDISHHEKTLSNSLGVGGYMAIQASTYLLTVLASGVASCITYLGIGKLFREE